MLTNGNILFQSYFCFFIWLFIGFERFFFDSVANETPSRQTTKVALACGVRAIKHNRPSSSLIHGTWLETLRLGGHVLVLGLPSNKGKRDIQALLLHLPLAGLLSLLTQDALLPPLAHLQGHHANTERQLPIDHQERSVMYQGLDLGLGLSLYLE